jgi:two-component system invasion response regulator UvrY
MNQIKLLLADHHQLIRSILTRLLSDKKDILVIAEATTGEEAVQMSRELKPDIVLLDIDIPGIGGFGAMLKIRHHQPAIKIITLIMDQTDPRLLRLVEVGVSGYLTKNCSMQELYNAIHQVALGKHYISPPIAQELALKNITNFERSPLDNLSSRELQMMLMIISGKSNQEIAQKLCLSSRTISAYRLRIFKKLKVKNDVGLVLAAKRLGFIKIECG